MELISFENFGTPLNEGMTYDQIIKLPRVEDLSPKDLPKLNGAVVKPIPQPNYNINKFAQAAGQAAFNKANLKEKPKPTFYLVGKDGKGICVLV